MFVHFFKQQLENQAITENNLESFFTDYPKQIFLNLFFQRSFTFFSNIDEMINFIFRFFTLFANFKFKVY